MQIVIDIPMEMYSTLNNIPMEMYSTLNNIPMGDISVLEALYAIKNGIPLPEGHGRLIDSWALDKEVINHVHSGDAESSKDCAKFSLMIMTAPTVIGADKEE